MKAFFATLVAAAPLVAAHYTIPQLTVNGAISQPFQYIRETANHYSNGPVTSVTDQAIRCYELDYSATAPATSTAQVTAGSSLTFTANGPIYHQGTINVYMAKASPAANSASAGTGAVWFKVFQNTPVYQASSHSFTFPSTTASTITFTVPKNLPSGQYLIRAEQIALHVASTYGAAQFYIGCAQVNVVNGGSGSPGPLVSFPGAYTGYEPGILINIYNLPSNFTGYVSPGPKVWSG